MRKKTIFKTNLLDVIVYFECNKCRNIEFQFAFSKEVFMESKINEAILFVHKIILIDQYYM